MAMDSQNPFSTTPLTSTSKINAIQSTKIKSQEPQSKKKGKGKKNKDNPLWDKKKPDSEEK